MIPTPPRDLMEFIVPDGAQIVEDEQLLQRLYLLSLSRNLDAAGRAKRDAIYAYFERRGVTSKIPRDAWPADPEVTG